MKLREARGASWAVVVLVTFLIGEE